MTNDLTPEQWRAWEAGEKSLAEIDLENEQRAESSKPSVTDVPESVEAASEHEFFVPGKPVTWKRTGGGKRRYTPKVCREYRKLIQRHARSSDVPMFPGVVRIRIDVYLGGGSRGDVDNYAKAYLDALEGMAFDNDRLVADLRVVRHYKTEHEDGAVIRIECIDDEVVG